MTRVDNLFLAIKAAKEAEGILWAIHNEIRFKPKKEISRDLAHRLEVYMLYNTGDDND